MNRTWFLPLALSVVLSAAHTALALRAQEELGLAWFWLIVLVNGLLFLVGIAFGCCPTTKPNVMKPRRHTALIKAEDLDTNLVNNHYSEANSRFAKDYVELLRKTRRSVAQQRKEGPNHG